MDLPPAVKRYRHPISFVLALLIVMGSFFAGWLLTILTPVFVFLVLKFFGVWRNRERLAIGIPALIAGMVLFFFVFSHQLANVEYQEFSTDDFVVKVHPYSSTNFNDEANIEVIYNRVTNSTLSYEVNSTFDGKTISTGEVPGIVVNNKSTKYAFTVQMDEGIYYVKMYVDGKVIYGEVIREKPEKLFQYFLYHSGAYLGIMLSVLYGLLIFGAHIYRRGQEMARLRYERGN